MPAEKLDVADNFNYLSGSAKRKALCIACSYPGTNLALPGTIPDQEAMVSTLTRNGCVGAQRHCGPWPFAARARRRPGQCSETRSSCWSVGVPRPPAWRGLHCTLPPTVSAPATLFSGTM